MASERNAAGFPILEEKAIKPVEVQTRNSCGYNFVKTTLEAIRFSVAAASDAHIALTYNPSLHPPMYVIKLGLNDNRSAIDKDKAEVVSITTPRALLSRSESREYWIRWDKGTIAVGREGEDKPFMSYTDKDLIPIRYVGFCTKNGSVGDWSVRAIPERSPNWYPGGNWIWSSGGSVPSGAVVGGQERGRDVYVVRVFSCRGVIPGKLIAGDRCAYYMFDNGRERSREIYEVLCDFEGEWVPAQHGQLPPEALLCGRLWQSEQLYAARARHGNDLIPGLVRTSVPACVITYHGREVHVREYEVLTYGNK